MKRLVYALLASLLASTVIAAPRERILMVGDANMLSFSQSVARQFSDHWEYRAPFLDVTGTGVGIGLFCDGVGYEHPDIVATTRPMSKTERRVCSSNGINHLTEIQIGQDAVVLVKLENHEPVDFTRAQLFAALWKEAQNDAVLVRNVARHWSDIGPQLPSNEILIMGAEASSVIESAFLQKVMAAGCADHPTIKTLDDERRFTACHTVRTDGRYIRATKRVDKVIDWLEDNPKAFAVLDYMTARKFDHLLDLVSIEGVQPTPASIRSGEYPLAFSLYLYVKDKHAPAIPGLQQFVYEYTSERAIGPDGYLATDGWITLDDMGRNRARDSAITLGLE